MNDDAAAQYFRNVVRQYQGQIGLDTASYLLQTYQMGQRDIAFSNLVGCLIDLGFDEDQLMQGPLAQLAQALQVPATSSAEADPSAIRIDPTQRPDPFAASQDSPEPLDTTDPRAALREASQAHRQSTENSTSQPQNTISAARQQPKSDENATLHIQQ